jgi:hypothetical protein
MLSREAFFLRFALCLIPLVATGTATAQSHWYPCGSPLRSSFNYPVIVYDAQKRITVLAYKKAVTDLIERYKNQRTPIPFEEVRDLNSDGYSPAFLCYGRAVEVYVLNRQLKTAFTVTLTAAIQSNTGRPEISGYSQAVAAAQSPPSTPTPPTKGFAPVATGTNLLTTDQIINYFLNEEQFDRPVAKIMDDAAVVVAQANQLKINYEQYIAALRSISGAPPPGDEGNLTIPKVTERFDRLAQDVQGRTPDEKIFDDWTGRVDRLQTDVARINTKLQTYPVVDTLINIRASAATVNDNIRGVRNEFVSLALARSILLTLLTEYRAANPADQRGLPPYLQERTLAEIRTMLRTQYPASTVDELTLARIVSDYRPSPTGWLALRERLIDLNIQAILDPWVREINQTLTAYSGTPNAISLCAQPCLANFIPTDPIQPLIINLQPGIDLADATLQQLREAIRAMNDAEARTFQAINNIYDETTASYLVLNLNLTGYPKNLFVYYTISSTPQFHRYQIINETPQPQSACALTVSANTNPAGGAVTCTTAPSSAPPSASASFASTVPSSVIPSQPPSPAAPSPPAPASPSGAASAPASPSAPSSASAGAPSPSSASAPPDYYGSFEMHRITNAALITGVAYDSVPTQSFSWFTCPTSPTLPAGNPSSAAPGCISPTTPSGATTPSPTYYELLQTKQPFVGGIQGINIYILPQDTFTVHSHPGYLRFVVPSVFLGASVYPLNHYYVGLAEEGLLRGLSISTGLAYGSQNELPSNFPYKPGTVVTAAPTLFTSTRFKNGFFVMVGFHTSLFKAIFSGSAFQNTTVGTAGSPSGSAAPSH